VVARLAKVAEATELFAHLRGGPSVVSPSEEGRAFRGLLGRRPPTGLISTNSLAPTSWKNPRPHGKDVISRRRSNYDPGVNSTASAETSQPFGFGGPAFGGDRCRGDYSGGQAHRFRGCLKSASRGWGLRRRTSKHYEGYRLSSRARPQRPNKSRKRGRLRLRRNRPSSRA
jgi:hypothetical protein